MKLDLTQNGLPSAFTDWHIKTLEILSQGGEYTSATLTEKLNKNLSDGGVSRASVIGFMKDLETWGLVTVTQGMGRGGSYRIYKFDHTMKSVTEFLIVLAESWVKETKKELEEQKQ